MFLLKYLVLKTPGFDRGHFPHFNHPDSLFDQSDIFEVKLISFLTKEVQHPHEAFPNYLLLIGNNL